MNDATRSNGLVEHPRSWYWDDDGSTVSGEYVKLGKATVSRRLDANDAGERIILILNVAGEPRSIWVLNEILKDKLRMQLRLRPKCNFESGERLTITRSAEKFEAASGHNYWRWKVDFEHEVTESPRELFGLDKPEPARPPGEPEPVLLADEQSEVSDGVPF